MIPYPFSVSISVILVINFGIYVINFGNFSYRFCECWLLILDTLVINFGNTSYGFWKYWRSIFKDLGLNEGVIEGSSIESRVKWSWKISTQVTHYKSTYLTLKKRGGLVDARTLSQTLKVNTIFFINRKLKI